MDDAATTVMATFVVIAAVTGAIFTEWNVRRGDAPLTQHYAWVAVPVAFITATFWFGEPGPGWDEGFFYLVLAGLIAVAYGLPGSERNHRIARWVFRLSLAWAVIGWLAVSLLGSWLGWLVSGSTPGWLWLVTVAVFIAIIGVSRRRNPQQQPPATTGGNDT